MAAELLIYAIVAAGLVFWLRNILGTKHGGERERPNPFTQHQESIKKHVSGQNGGFPAASLSSSSDLDIHAGLERNMSIDNNDVAQDLIEITRLDHSFSLPHFLRGAQDAFILIIESFAAGDKETLKSLLNDSVFRAFDKVIEDRATKGEKAVVEIHAIRQTEILKAWVKDKTVFITVRFTADETSIVRDKEGEILFGDPERITETIDIWTFGRPLRSRSPVWFLYETREDEQDSVPGSTVPQGQ